MNPDFITGGFFAPGTDDDGPDDGLPASYSFRRDAEADALYQEMCVPDPNTEGDF